MGHTDPESWEAVAERLERIREALNMNKTEIAEALGISPQQWTNYTKPDNLIPVYVANRLCRLAGVTTDYIYRGISRIVIDPEMHTKLDERRTAKPVKPKRARA